MHNEKSRKYLSHYRGAIRMSRIYSNYWDESARNKEKRNRSKRKISRKVKEKKRKKNNDRVERTRREE